MLIITINNAYSCSLNTKQLMAEESKQEKLENGVENGLEESAATEKPEAKRLACKMEEMSEHLDQTASTSMEIPGAKVIRDR